MKYKKIIIAALCLIAVLSVVVLQAVCKNEQADSPSSRSTSGGESSEAIAYFYVIDGATDFYVDLSATKSSIDLSSITAYRENGDGTAVDVFMDDADVVWGKQGAYLVKYVAGESFVEKKIYIYDDTLPTLTGAVSKTVKSASEILSNVWATDQFGFSLAITYFVNGIEGASLAVGKNTVTYKATDLIGNTAEQSVVITLE